LAAGLRLDPLGELKRSPDPLPVIRGLLLGEGKEGDRDKRGGTVAMHILVKRLPCHNECPNSLFAQVCYHSATQSSQFDVSFPEKLLKIVAIPCEILA